MREILYHQEVSRSLRERGLKQSKQYSWEKTAGIVLETYNSLKKNQASKNNQ